MEPSDDFVWPTDPEQTWWEVTGAELRLRPEYVKFAASKFRLGGHGSRKNSLAASLAGIEATPSQSFRIAQSVAVRRLLTEAEKIRTGKRPAITEREIDQKIEDLIRSPDARSSALGIELRHKREDRSARARDAEPADIAEITRQLLVESGPEGAISAAELWHTVATNLMGCPYFTLIIPIIRARFPDLLSRYRAPMTARAEFFASEREQQLLAEFDAAAARPEPTDAEFRAAIGAAAPRRGNGAAPPEQPDEVENHAPA